MTQRIPITPPKTKQEREALIERLQAENAATRCDMAERRARQLRGEVPFHDEPAPGPQRRRLDTSFTAPVHRAAETSVRTETSPLEALADEVGEVTGRHERELQELRDEIGSLRADLEIARAAIKSNVTPIGNRHVA